MFKDKREETEPATSVERPESRPRHRPATRLNLARGADGRIRPADQTDIGDMWAHQERVRLANAIKDDKRKIEKRTQRQERWSRMKASLAKKHKSPKPVVKTVLTAPETSQASKEIVVSLSVPKIRLPKLSLRRLHMPKRRAAMLGAMVVGVIIFGASFALYPSSQPEKAKSKSDVASGSIKGESPKFSTLLPEGKKIDDLGGWARVSPPDAVPVFAYLDSVDGVAIRVSQQELPKDLRTSTYAKIEEVAKQFSANERVTADDLTAYVGTSIKGPQSVVFAKNNLLILIKSDSKISNDAWGTYINNLR